MALTWEDVKNESTIDLIEYIKYKGQADYQELAEASFIAFTFRFRKEIIDKCRKVGSKRGHHNEISDIIAERVFERFWLYPFSFKKDGCGDLDIDNCVRFYLFRIATNCFCDYEKEITGGNKSPYDGSEAVIVEFPDIDNLTIPEEKAVQLKKIYDLLEVALSKLSRKHKIIYLTYKAYEKEGYKLPRHLLKKLREELQLSQSSIRVYKNEAFQTVDQHLKIYGPK